MRVAEALAEGTGGGGGAREGGAGTAAEGGVGSGGATED